jgi:hypothetical protein
MKEYPINASPARKNTVARRKASVPPLLLFL